MYTAPAHHTIVNSTEPITDYRTYVEETKEHTSRRPNSNRTSEPAMQSKHETGDCEADLLDVEFNEGANTETETLRQINASEDSCHDEAALKKLYIRKTIRFFEHNLIITQSQMECNIQKRMKQINYHTAPFASYSLSFAMFIFSRFFS